MSSYFETALLDLKDAVLYGASMHGDADKSAARHATSEALLVGLLTYKYSQNGYYAIGAATADLFLRFEQLCYRNVELGHRNRRKHCRFGSYFIGLLLGLGVAMAPHNTEVRQADLNKDSYQDMIVKNNYGNTDLFLGDKNGNYTRLEDKEEINKIKESSKNLF